eukprot:symbB.v1.2.021208.t1/scaffold1822.1/size99790/3
MRVAPPSHPQNGPMPSQPMQPMQQQQQPMQPSMTAGQLPNSNDSNAFVGAGAAAMGQMGFNEALAGAALGQAMSQMQMSGAILFNVGGNVGEKRMVKFGVEVLS